MNGGIFLIQENGELVEMTEQKYDSEDLLQELLSKYPNLLAGDQIDSESPRRWLLVSREFGVPSQEQGFDRWSIDHLFLDQDAVPTLVEVKRSSDTRIRREVVGQMLDYAANAVVYWPVETIVAKFEARCETRNLSSEKILEKFLGDDSSDEQFWQKVKTNLQAGKLRMIFVADEIPSELRRIVECMNAQMDPAEVLAVEIRQYIGESLKTLVPRVIGLTAEAQSKKSGRIRSTKQWDASSFLTELESRRSKGEADVARRIMNWAESKSLWIKWGKGGSEGTFYPVLDHKGKSNRLFSVSTPGKLGIVFRDCPLETVELKLELFNRLNSIPGVSLPETSIDTWTGFDLSILIDDSNLKSLFEIFEWVIEEIKFSEVKQG